MVIDTCTNDLLIKVDLFHNESFIGDALDDRITKFEPIILEAIRMQEVKMEEEIELSDPTSAHQGVVYAVGRVCCDSLIENAKFNQKSVMLEASKSTGVGSRVELNLDDVLQTEDGISLFPGQIIGVRGIDTIVIVSSRYESIW